MKKNLAIAAKALLVFLAIGFVIPVLSDRKIDGIWVLSGIGISLAITVLPEYLIAKLKRKKKADHVITTRAKLIGLMLGIISKKWVRILGETLFLFSIMILVIPSLGKTKVDTAWLVISAIVSPIGAVIGDYLSEKQKERR